MFGAGKRLSSAFNLQPAGEEEKELDLKEFPTYFHHRKLDADETLKRSAAEDKPIRLNFTTDANDDYFIREERPGVIKVNLEGEKFKDEKILFSSSLRNGVYSINITQPEIAEIGDILKYKFEVNDITQDKPFVNEAVIEVTEYKERPVNPNPPRPKPPKPPKPGEKKEVPGGLNIPMPIWVSKEEWDNYDFEAFDEYDALAVQYVGEEESGKNKVDKYNYYLNGDNFYLLNELKIAKPDMREVIKERFQTSLVLSAVSILAQIKIDHKDEDQEEGIKRVRNTTRALSRIILPTIQVLGSLSEQDLTIADD